MKDLPDLPGFDSVECKPKMCPLPQHIFLAADGQQTLDELLTKIKTTFADQVLEADLDELAMYEIINLSREGLLMLSDTPVETPG